jgi:hypothetical protein
MPRRRRADPPPLPTELFTALVNRLAELILADLDMKVEGRGEVGLARIQDESTQPAHHQPVTRRRPCA